MIQYTNAIAVLRRVIFIAALSVLVSIPSTQKTWASDHQPQGFCHDEKCAKPPIDCSKADAEIDKLRGRNRGLSEAANAHSAALIKAEELRFMALAKIYGSDGAAAKFIENLANSMPGMSGLQRDLVTYSRIVGGRVLDPDHRDRENNIEIAEQVAEDAAELGIALGGGAVASRVADKAYYQIVTAAAKKYYKHSGDAAGATQIFLKGTRAKGARFLIKLKAGGLARKAINKSMDALDVVLALKGLYVHGSELAELINDWIEAKRDAEEIQRELDKIIAEIEANNARIKELMNACPGTGKRAKGELLQSPRIMLAAAQGLASFDGTFRVAHEAWSSSGWLEETLTDTEFLRLAAADGIKDVAVGRNGNRSEPDMEMMLRTLTQLHSILPSIADIHDRILTDLWAPLSPFIYEVWPDLPLPVIQELLAMITANAPAAEKDFIPLAELGQRVVSNLELSAPAADRLTYQKLWEAKWSKKPAPDSQLTRLGPDAKASVPVLMGSFMNPSASQSERDFASATLVEIGKVLGTGLQIDLAKAFKAPLKWTLVPRGAPPSSGIVSGHELPTKDLSLPPGSYDLLWEHESHEGALPMRFDRAVTVNKKGKALLALNTGIRLNTADWVPKRDGFYGWWGAVKAGEAPDKRVNWSKTASALLLPMGSYDIYWAQEFETRDTPMRIAADVTVGKGAIVNIAADSGVALKIGDGVPKRHAEYGWWGAVKAGEAPDKRVNWSKTASALLLPMGSYDIYWAQEFETRDTPMRIAADVTVGKGAIVNIAADSGVALKIGDGVPKRHAEYGWWGAVKAGEAPDKRVNWSKTASALLLPMGSYDIYWAQEFETRDTPMRIAADVTVGKGAIVNIAADSGVALKIGDGVPKRHAEYGWWGAVKAGEAPDKRVNWSKTASALLLPPGNYDLYWKQDNESKPEVFGHGVKVSSGAMVTVRFD